MRLRARITVLAALALGSLACAAQQAYPSRPIRIIIPLAAGSLTDVITRGMLPRLSAALGVPVVIENMPGAGGVVGSGAGAKAVADGYTFLMGTSGAFSASPHMYKNLPYNPVKDFSGVCRFGGGSYVLAVYPGLGVKTIPELLAKTRATPLSFASSGLGSTPHMAQELFKSRMGAPFVHVPYKGTPQAVSDTIGGHAHLLLETPGPLQSNIAAGKLHAIGIMSARRSPTLPDVPTFDELGYHGLRLQGWVGLVAPVGTPKAAIDKMAQACQGALTAPEVMAQAQATGFDIDYAGPVDFTAAIATELERWGQLVRLAGLKPE